jgi:hypothetical protein
MGGACGIFGGGGKLRQEFGGEAPKGKKLIWKVRRRWEGVTEVKQEIRWGGEDWI